MIGSTNVVPRFKPPTIYRQIQRLVRQGKVQEQYSLGDIITIPHGDYGDIDWQVVAFDVAIPADSSFTHSMTLCTKDCVDRLMFDNKEPSSPNYLRKNSGNNRYAYSAIRQWLNFDKTAGEWWAAQHEYDAAPDYATTKDGFMKGLDEDFLAVIGKTKIKVAIPTVDGGGYEELEDYFYLPSRTEIGLGIENNVPEGVNFPYFNSNGRRKKQYNGSDYNYWCRTPYSGNGGSVYFVNTNGTSDNNGAYIQNGIVPFCNII